MKIGIIGAGSIGMLFASYLSRVFNVTLYTRTNEQAERIKNNGMVLINGNQKTEMMINTKPFIDWIGTEELTIIAVKQYQLQAVFAKINDLFPIPNNLLFIQNGMNHLKLLSNLHAANIFVGSVEHGAHKENAFTVHHNGEGKINAAVFKGDALMLRNFANKAPLEFPVTVKDDYYHMLLNKLIVNAVINPLTAILRVENGKLIENPFYFDLLRKLFIEISFILNLENTDLHLKNLIDICKKTANNRSSMLKDLEAERRTEVDAILGFLLDEAKRQEKHAPQLECLFFVLKGKEIEWGKHN